MKIVEISAVFPPYRGGIGSVCRQNARMLAQAGHEVTVLTPRYKRLRSLTKAEEKQDGYTIKRLSPLFEFGNAAIIPQLKHHLHKADVVHLHVPFIGIGKDFLKLKHQKLLVTYHMDLIGRDWKKTFFTRYTQKMLPKIIDRADKVLVTSFDYARHSNIGSLLKVGSTKFVDVPNSVDSARYMAKPKNQDLIDRHNLHPDDKVVLYVGGLDSAHYFKGIEYLLEAFELIVDKQKDGKHYKLILVGDGDLKPRYQSMAAQMGIGDNVIFAGDPSDELVCDYYNLCDVFALPSIDSSEAFGMVLVEAMACGKPVVTTDLPGPRSVVEDGKNGFLVKPRNAVDLAEKLYTILADDALAAVMGKRSKVLVDEKYSYSVVSKRLEEIVMHL